MKFFLLRNEEDFGTKYARSGGYWPFESMIFFESIPENHKQRLLEFWKINPGQSGMKIDQGGINWPDSLRIFGLGWPSSCCSSRVIDDLRETGIEIWRTTAMPISMIKSKRLLKKPAPMYYVLEAEPGIDVDYQASGLPVGDDGEPILRLRTRDAKGPFTVRSSSWNGKHLLSFRTSIASTLTVLCTEKIKALCEEKGWTNFRFEEIPSL